ncbi:MAG: hypothetical protein IJ757_02355 [Clostridiales bacterium]|nr:hypothetical protein [Clostridiales bacterium]
MINKTHHELLIAYYKDRLSKLPNGTFGTRAGNSVMYIHHDPNMWECDKTKRIEYKGQFLRSKNELIICKTLENRGYEFKSEIEVKCGSFNQFYPDVTFFVPELDIPICIESDGAMDRDGYYEKSESRKKRYLNSGFAEIRDVIFIRIMDPYSFDNSLLDALIDASIIANIRNIDLGFTD